MGSSKGLTLIELLIVIGVVGIFLAGMTFAFFGIWRAWGYQLDRDDSRSQSGFAMQKMEKELRGLLRIDSANSNAITFYFDLNDNGREDKEESVTYSWSGNPGDNLIRSWGTQQVPLAHSVQNFSLLYFNANDMGLIPPVANPGLIRRLTINLTTEIKDEVIHLRTDIRPRNL